MDLTRSMSILLTTALIAVFPVSTLAQDTAPTPEDSARMPELTAWTVASQRIGDELVPVPLGIEATLVLEDGTATGSGGCNSFSGSYALAGSGLTIGEDLVATAGGCDDPVMAVEDAYLAALFEVATWALSDGVLELQDVAGETILVLEPPADGLTGSRIDQLLARLTTAEAAIATLEQRVDDISISRLRDRIRTLESDNATLRRQLEALQAANTPSSSGDRARFNAAEGVLLEGVPPRIADTCTPLRARLPSGTAAAVECSPDTARVTEIAYYLLNGPRAVALFNDRLDAAGAPWTDTFGPPGQPSCADGEPSYVYADGGGIAAVGCYLDGGRANLRIIQDATACKQLKAGKRQLKRPVMYVAMSGDSADIVPLFEWAFGGRGVIGTIDRPNARKATGVGCP